MSLISKITAADWLLLFLGFAIPIVYFVVKNLLHYFKDYKRLTPILGTWYAYHWSRANYQPVFRHVIVKIYRSWTGKIKIATNDSEDSESFYIHKGQIQLEGNQLVMTGGSGSPDGENWNARYLNSIAGTDISDIKRGLIIGQDFDRKLFALFVMMFREPQDEEKVKENLKQSIKFFPNEQCMRFYEEPLNNI